MKPAVAAVLLALLAAAGAMAATARVLHADAAARELRRTAHRVHSPSRSLR